MYLGDDGRLDLSAFISAVVGELNPTRRQVVREVFSSLDRDGRGAIAFSTFRGLFVAARHPDVERGMRSAGEVTSEFLQTFRTATGISDGGVVKLADFERYNEFVSASMPSDEVFVRYIRRVWNSSAPGAVPPTLSAPKTSATMSGGASAQGSGSVQLATVLAVLRDKLMQRTTSSESIGSVLARAFRFVRFCVLHLSSFIFSCCFC